MAQIDPAKIIDLQRNDWNNAAPAWEKWDRWLDESMSGVDSVLADTAGIALGQKALDLGSGTGYPAIAVAKRAGESGEVVGLDLSEKMLDVARKKSDAIGVNNISFKTCDISSIPFGDDNFDAITSRFCLMFLPRLLDTLNEARRVLKPGGKVAVAVWAAPEKNPALSLPMGVMKDFIDVPPPDPEAPGLFGLAAPGKLKGEMEKAGFSGVDEKEIGVIWQYSSGEEFVQMLKDLAAPMKAMFAKLSPVEMVEVDKRMARAAEEFRSGDQIKIPGVALMASGRK